MEQNEFSPGGSPSDPTSYSSVCEIESFIGPQILSMAYERPFTSSESYVTLRLHSWWRTFVGLRYDLI